MPARKTSVSSELPIDAMIANWFRSEQKKKTDKRAAKEEAQATDDWLTVAPKRSSRSKAESKVEEAQVDGQPSTLEEIVYQDSDPDTPVEDYFRDNYVDKPLRPKNTAGDEALARRLQIEADRAYARNLERQSSSSSSSSDSGILQSSSTICEEIPNYQGPAQKAARKAAKKAAQKAVREQKERRTAFEALVDDINMAGEESEEDAEEFSE